jgi:hypothetical protein
MLVSLVFFIVSPLCLCFLAVRQRINPIPPRTSGKLGLCGIAVRRIGMAIATQSMVDPPQTLATAGQFATNSAAVTCAPKQFCDIAD